MRKICSIKYNLRRLLKIKFISMNIINIVILIWNFIKVHTCFLCIVSSSPHRRLFFNNSIILINFPTKHKAVVVTSSYKDARHFLKLSTRFDRAVTLMIIDWKSGREFIFHRERGPWSSICRPDWLIAVRIWDAFSRKF